jgi:hypothetical protein
MKPNAKGWNKKQNQWKKEFKTKQIGIKRMSTKFDIKTKWYDTFEFW